MTGNMEEGMKKAGGKKENTTCANPFPFYSTGTLKLMVDVGKVSNILLCLSYDFGSTEHSNVTTWSESLRCDKFLGVVCKALRHS